MRYLTPPRARDQLFRRGYLPERYELHMLLMRLRWPALNVFMEES